MASLRFAVLGSLLLAVRGLALSFRSRVLFRGGDGSHFVALLYVLWLEISRCCDGSCAAHEAMQNLIVAFVRNVHQIKMKVQKWVPTGRE